MSARIYIDCEFNGWVGELISFAMVADDGVEFYSVLPEPRVWDKWCFNNVRPVLNQEPCASFEDFRVAFLAFLRGYRNPTIIADWPADLYYFNKVLLGSSHEESVLIPCRFELVGCDISPAIPHNALSDARAIRDALTPPLPPLETDMSEWQHIATAPKDGKRVLLYGDYVYPGDEAPTEYTMIGAWEEREFTDGVRTGWVTDEGMHTPGFFSHWQPLPPPPTRSETT